MLDMYKTSIQIMNVYAYLQIMNVYAYLPSELSDQLIEFNQRLRTLTKYQFKKNPIFDFKGNSTF